MSQGQIYGNLAAIRERMAEAAHRAGRNPEEIRLVAVSKTVPAETVWEAFLAGQLDFGESRVQELKAKDEFLRKKKVETPGNTTYRWHMIGYLQTNKVRPVVERCVMIHSMDRLALGEAVSREAAKLNRTVPVLIEVNVGGEASKAGVAPEKAPELAAALAALKGIVVAGLMTVPPLVQEPEEARPYFRKLRQLGEEISSLRIPGVNIRELSMGMSHDFEVAVEEGATMVRIGTAIFGPRNRG